MAIKRNPCGSVPKKRLTCCASYVREADHGDLNRLTSGGPLLVVSKRGALLQRWDSGAPSRSPLPYDLALVRCPLGSVWTVVGRFEGEVAPS